MIFLPCNFIWFPNVAGVVAGHDLIMCNVLNYYPRIPMTFEAVSNFSLLPDKQLGLAKHRNTRLQKKCGIPAHSQTGGHSSTLIENRQTSRP